MILTCPLTPLQFLLWHDVFWSIVFWRHWWHVVPYTMTHTLPTVPDHTPSPAALTLILSYTLCLLFSTIFFSNLSAQAGRPSISIFTISSLLSLRCSITVVAIQTHTHHQRPPPSSHTHHQRPPHIHTTNVLLPPHIHTTNVLLTYSSHTHHQRPPHIHTTNVLLTYTPPTSSSPFLVERHKPFCVTASLLVIPPPGHQVSCCRQAGLSCSSLSE